MHLIHRGIVSKHHKENLLQSFKQSFKKGYGIETDIHATKDNEFICFHDFTLKRIFKRNLNVKNINYSKIKDVSTRLNKPIPLLKDLLKFSKNRYPLFIEIKPIFSKSLLKKLLKDTSKYILSHHERWDGGGYPNGLVGDKIPLLSQIISVADCWHAMISKRSYKNKFTEEDAIKDLIKNRGTQFSPKIVDIFIEKKLYLINRYFKENKIKFRYA